MQVASKRVDVVRHLGRGPRVTVVAALSELAGEVQRRRTVSDVLETAGQGVLRLGMRLYAFEVAHDELVLRYLATARSRYQAIERRIGRALRGLRAPLADVPLASEVVRARRIIHRDDLEVFNVFVRQATGFDLSLLDEQPQTAGINNGVLAPIFVRERPWGLLGVVSSTLTPDDADAVALFATHVGSALEVAESIEALERTNRELASCNAQLARAHEELLERERHAVVGELAGVVAHEVRGPLCVLFNAIAGIREHLRAGSPTTGSGDAEALASMAAEEADQLNRIVSDLVEFARPHPPQLAAGSLVPVLDSVAAATAPDGRVRVEIDGELPTVQLDPLFMQRALLNLVLNALQASSKDGTVTLRASAHHEHGCGFARVDVTVDGLGIPACVRASVLEPFFTSKPSRTGLGLAVVKRIVESHGGHMLATSCALGTTYTVKLPAVDHAAGTDVPRLTSCRRDR